MNKNFSRFFSDKIQENILVKKELDNLIIKKKILQCINVIHNSLSSDGKILLCGNGGSAADAQHLAAEFLVRLRPDVNRKPFPAIALAMDVSTITACANDYSFNNLFSRNLDAIGKKNDILIALSTSGNSQNILNVLKMAKKKNNFLSCFLRELRWQSKKFS